MNRRTAIGALGLLLMMYAATVRAHSDYRVVGTLTRVTEHRLEVKQTKDGLGVSVDMNPSSVVTRDGKKVATSTLKVGQTVVVDATGDSLRFLVAKEVRIVPPPEKPSNRPQK